MSFRLFGVPVEIQVGFWVTAFVLGLRHLRNPTLPKVAIAVWIAVVLVSILAHELGHAFALKRHKIQPEIALHWMGGTTSWRMLLPLSRPARIVVSLAGPFAGFAIAGAIYGTAVAAPGLFERLPDLAIWMLGQLIEVNLYWGVINLIPVLPFDGGHVLEHALGPKRERTAALVSLIIGGVVALYFLLGENIWGAVIFGMGAAQSYQRWRGEGPATTSMPAQPSRPAPRAPDLSPTAARLLREAKEALADEHLDRAAALAKEILAGEPPAPGLPAEPAPPAAAHAALEVIAWTHLLAGRVDEAAAVLDAVRRIQPADRALVGAVLHARRDLAAARKVLEAARAEGDDRKEIVGPLIQILLEQGEVARAAAIAFDIVESLSEEDARRMAALAFEGGAFSWSARLYEAVFARRGRGDDAYDAARALAQGGEHDRAIELLRRAVEAGFSDRARAWSDAALSALRAEPGMEAVLPRP